MKEKSKSLIEKPLIKIRWVDRENYESLEDALYVRKEVFVKEQNVPEAEEYDEIDLKAYHIIAYINKIPVATGRLFKEQDTWFIGRICVLKEYRKNRIGKLIIKALSEKALNLRATELHLHAQTHAMDFYKKFGFKAYGNTFSEAGIKHILMLKTF